MEKTIGILGGMGPLATADLFRKITLLTDAARDNDHIRVYIDSNARIPGPHGGHFVRRQRSRAGNGLGPALAGGLRRQLRHHALQHRALFSPPPAGP